MKKKIAICANGWNYDSLLDALGGITQYAAKEDFDVFVFVSFASYSDFSNLAKGELNIYRLMEPSDYDGIIVFSTALNSVSTVHHICDDAKSKNIPIVSIGMEIEGVHSVCISNEQGMRELLDHLIEVHHVKRPFFVGGTVDHVDSIARLKVTKEAFEAHGIPFDIGENVGYGNWSNRYTCELIDRLIDSGKKLPDAFICANDIMAMAACAELEERGYLVPEATIVTGFDNCREGKIFYPALSSVKQDYVEIALKACDIIFSEIKGEKEIRREVVPSKFSCGESCGCRGEIDYAANRILYCRHQFRRNQDAKLLDQNERVMRQFLTDMPTYSALKRTLCEHYKQNHQFEGEGFYICVNEDYFSDVMISEEDIWKRGKESGIEAVLSLIGGESVDNLPVDVHRIVPGYEKKEGEQHVYTFLPMHYFEHNYGYAVITDLPFLVREDMLYSYMEKLQHSIRLMRTNLRLKALYDRDQMTGLYNRFGYENKALPLYQESLEDRKKITVMFVDINYMKRINDRFGHLHGDNAIRTVVEAINDTIDKKAVAVRFGGDEFLLILPDCDEEKALHTKESILSFLERKNAEKEVPYDISVSIGYVVSDPVGRPYSVLEDYIREADKEMYEIKKEMHIKMDRRKPRD